MQLDIHPEADLGGSAAPTEAAGAAEPTV